MLIDLNINCLYLIRTYCIAEKQWSFAKTWDLTPHSAFQCLCLCCLMSNDSKQPMRQLCSPNNMQVHLRDRSAWTVVGAATLKQKLQIKHTNSPWYSILTTDQLALALTVWHQAPGWVWVATGVPVVSLVWHSRGKGDLIPASPASEAESYL